jgi:hypothetical protein
MNVISGKLTSDEQARKWLSAVLRNLAPMFAEGKAVACEFFDGKTRAQERLTHSCYRDLSRDCLLNGIKASEGDWKDCLKMAFYQATKDDPDYTEDWRRRRPRMIPALDGDGYVMTTIESRGFTKNLYRGFITFIHSVGDERGVRWSRTSLGRDAYGDDN